MIKDVAIVLTIYDGYEDMWDDCIRLLKKNWVDHPPIYVFTNEVEREWEDVFCMPVGKDAEWSLKVQKALEIVREKYFVMLLEDFYIGAHVSTRNFEELLSFVKSNQIDYCKLCENNEVIHRKKKAYKKGFPYEVIYEDQCYGISLQASLWRRDFLAKLVGSDNYNAWVFELRQVEKAKKGNHAVWPNAICDARNILNIKHGALQGKMLPPTVAYFQEKGDPLETNRAVMDKKDYRNYYIKQLGQDVAPKWAVGFIKNIARRFGYTFVSDKWQ